MGGGTSRFEETDWDTATGKLSSNEETVDGAEPTQQYGVYYITKQGVNQRDYDVTDEDANLLYTTKAVEGTLAWFDVLGPGIDDYKLRVQVDLSRRYWVIYSFGIPAYAGQFADMRATTQIREARGERLPCLYKKACVTVSWSRYYAIVNRYGPPPTDEELSNRPDTPQTTPTIPSESSWNDQPADSNDRSYGPARSEPVIDNGEAAMDTPPDESSDISMELPEQPKDPPPPPPPEANEEEEESADVDVGSGVEESKTEMPSPTAVRYHADEEQPSAVNDESASSFHYADEDGHVIEASTNADLDAAAKKAHVPKARIKQWKAWAKRSLGDKTATNPLEGTLDLEDPLMKCEEINSFMGQHQTMFVSEDEMKQIKEEELKAAQELGADAERPDGVVENPSLPTRRPKVQNFSQRSFREQFGVSGSTMNMSFREQFRSSSSRSIGMTKTNTFPRIRKFAKWVSDKRLSSSEEQQVNELREDSDDSQFTMPEISVTPTNGERNGTASDESAGVEESKEEPPTLGDESAAPPQNLEPLIGYWIWDNTYKVHRMRLHVAAESDLALHIVLGIVTNQLRLERNVVLSTV